MTLPPPTPRWLLQGVLPTVRRQLPTEVLAGITLAALSIPEVLGYAKIAGMPVVTGLYTLLLPLAVFAVLGSSRHLVVAADSATAAMLAGGMTGLAAPGSPRYVALAGLVALLAGALLLLARLARLGFLGDFLSRTVLIGFLTGVGIQVAVGQLPRLIGIQTAVHGTIGTLLATARGLRSLNPDTAIVSASVMVVVVGARQLTNRVPGALIAVAGAIAASHLLALPRRGVAVVGAVPHGLPGLTLPAFAAHDVTALFATAAAMVVVILAQSSATARSYADRYDEPLSEDTDLVGLGVANLAAGVTGTFVVNGSPTKTQLVDSAGGRSQLAQLVASLSVLLVLLFVTGPLAALPLAALSSIVFLIALELVDVRGLRRIFAVRRDEFSVALLTATAVVLLGVEQGIALAVVASVITHLRTSYAPRNTVLRPAADGHFESIPAEPTARTAPGLVIYRFSATLYYANAHRLVGEVTAFLAAPSPPVWFCLDCVAVGDIDFTAADALRRIHTRLHAAGSRLLFTNTSPAVRSELDRYRIAGSDRFFAAPHDVLAGYRQQPR